MGLRLECINRDGEGGFKKERISKKIAWVTYSVKSMGGARAGDEIRSHQFRVV